MNSKKFLINFLLFKYILSIESIFRLCNLNSYSKKNKIINDINLIDIISTIIKKKMPVYYQKNCVTKLPVANKTDDIFAHLTEKERFFFTLLLKKSKKYLYINIGKVTKWGFPISKNLNISNYSKLIFKKFENDYDFVFIDGIARVACALQIILNCKPDIKILIHDFNNRPYYHILYKYLDIIYAIDTFALFSIKEDIDIEEIKKDYEIYKSDVR